MLKKDNLLFVACGVLKKKHLGLTTDFTQRMAYPIGNMPIIVFEEINVVHGRMQTKWVKMRVELVSYAYKHFVILGGK